MDNRFSIPVAAPDCSFIVSVLHNIQHIVTLDKGLGNTKRPLTRTRRRRGSIFSAAVKLSTYHAFVDIYLGLEL